MIIDGATLIIPDDREFFDTDVLNRPIRDSNRKICQTIKTVIIGKFLSSLRSYDGNPEPFSEYSSLERITVSPDNTTFRDIDGVLFSKDGTRLITFPDCHSTEYVVPDSVIHIERSAFDFANGLERITLGKNVRTIGLAAFFHCPKLRNIEFQAGVESIGPGAFSFCSSLGELELPASIEDLGTSLFYECPSLETVSIPDSPGQRFRTVDGAIYDARNKSLVRVPPGYQNKTFIIQPDTEEIGDYAFYACNTLEEIQIPASVSRIDGKSVTIINNLQRFNVDKHNRYLCDIDGVLFNKDKTRLIAYPGGRHGSYTIPKTVQELCDYCFFSVIYPKKTLDISYPDRASLKKGLTIFNPKTDPADDKKENNE